MALNRPQLHQKRRLCALAHDRKGTALLESAVVIPVILLIGLGVIEFANFFYHRHLIEAGVRDAARYLAALPLADPQSELDAEDIALTGEIGNTTDYRVSWWNDRTTIVVTNPPTSDSFTVGSDDYTLRNSDGTNVYAVRVSATVPYQSLGFLTGFLGLGNITFNVVHEERHIGNR